ncbi:MAG: hypothetical protein IKA12_04565, partial [Clostridia bacterium]|nr:hypothetical protein [Clostridia bacterium]
NCYYVSSDYGYVIANGINSSAGKRALVCENDTTLADTASGTFTAGVGLTVGINRYTSIANVPNTEGVITNVSWKVVENAIVWNA